jgi:hypothetical protein
VSPGWVSRVQQEIAEQEYHLTWQSRTQLGDLPEAWHAPNRAHGFRTYFTDDGIRVITRTGERPSWEWGLSLTGYGRDGDVWPAEKGILTPEKNRIEYDRGAIVEWYENTPRGLKQGFTLAVPPEEAAAVSRDGNVTPMPGPARGRRTHRAAARDAGRDPGLDGDGLIFLNLQLTGTLSPTISAGGQAIDFTAPGGARVVRYSELVVTDAFGRELPAWMEGFSGKGSRGIRIVVDDADAVYPVMIDPLATSPAWTAESDQADAQLGWSVATAGDVNGDGLSDVIVGAHLYDNGQADEGRAFVFHGSATGLSPAANWTAESDQAGARLGFSVATAGDVSGDGYGDVVIGASLFDNGHTDEGRAFVYLGSATGLPGGPNAGPGDAGWTAESDQGGAQLGISVATAGDVNGDGFSDVIVGAWLHDNGQADEGRAFVYHGSATGLSGGPNAGPGDADWTAESNQGFARFGLSVGTAGDVNGDGFSDVVAGAWLYDNGQADEGRAFVYHGSATGLPGGPNAGPGDADWTAESDQASAQLGFSVATAGDVNGDGFSDIIVGAWLYDNGQGDEGRAFVYHGSATGLSGGPGADPNDADWTAESDQASAQLGVSVATAGDVNGDGFADVIVGAKVYDNGQTDEGRAFVFHGSATGLSGAPWADPNDADWTAESDQASAQLGVSVATAGDVNGDGFSEVIVGAYLHDNGQTDEGRAFVFHGSASGLSGGPNAGPGDADWTAESDQASAELGISVATAGDVNGDGFADVIVGAHKYDNGPPDEGSVFVHHGSATGLSPTANWTAEGGELGVGVQLGISVATAGDVNGDGFSEVIVGAPFFDNGQQDEGIAVVYLGSATGLFQEVLWTAESDQADAELGISVATAGDVNGDGFSDVIVGAWLYDNGETNEGRAFVFHGSATGLPQRFADPNDADWTAESDQASVGLGHSVATAGDVNGDGFSDVIVGAPFYHNGQSNEGRAFVFHGSASGLSGGPNAGPLDADWTAESDQASANLGFSVATAGDVNGDGFSDLVVGAPFYDNGQTDEGRAFVYHGSASGLSGAPNADPNDADWTAESDQASAELGISVRRGS